MDLPFVPLRAHTHLRVLFQNTLSANPTIDVAMPMSCFTKRALPKYVQKNTIFELDNDIGIASSFYGMALKTFGKNLLYLFLETYSYIYEYIYIFIYMKSSLPRIYCRYICAL